MVDPTPFCARGAGAVGQHHLYDLDVDPDETKNRCGETIDADMIDLRRTARREVDAPSEPFARLGIGAA